MGDDQLKSTYKFITSTLKFTTNFNKFNKHKLKVFLFVLCCVYTSANNLNHYFQEIFCYFTFNLTKSKTTQTILQILFEKKAIFIIFKGIEQKYNFL